MFDCWRLEPRTNEALATRINHWARCSCATQKFYLHKVIPIETLIITSSNHCWLHKNVFLAGGQVLCLCLWSFPFLVLADTSFVWPCYCCSFVLDCYIVWCFCMKLLVIASSLLFQQLYMIIILSLWITFFEVWSGDSGRLRKDISLGDLHLFFYAAVNMAVEWSWCFFLNKLIFFMLFFMFTENDPLRGCTQVVLLNPLWRGKGGACRLRSLRQSGYVVSGILIIAKIK